MDEISRKVLVLSIDQEVIVKHNYLGLWKEAHI